MGKVSCGLAVELNDLIYAQGAQQAWNGNSAGGIDGIDSYFEVGLADGFYIYQRERQHFLDVAVDGVEIFGYVAEGFHIGVGKFIAFSQAEYFVAFCGIDKFALCVE